MNTLKPLVQTLELILNEFNITEDIDIKLTSIDDFDYQINNLVKHQKHEKIKDIEKKVISALNTSEIVEVWEISEKYFINIKISLSILINLIDPIDVYLKLNKKEKIIIDYGGPNIGKPLHVGHLRSLNIGRSLYKINKFVGNDVISDIHLGDWGMQIAQILTFCHIQKIKIDSLDAKKLLKIYPESASLYKKDEVFSKAAQETNKKLNENNLEEIEKWKKIKTLSENSLRDTLNILNHSFDLWLGESDVNELIPKMINDLKENNKVRLDNEALVSAEETDPPILITKSDGSYLYLTTDLATVIYRINNIDFDKILYVVDNRQKLHFKQLFQSIKYFGFPNKEYVHVEFGTVNDEDGNPFRTRDGDTKLLTELYQETYDYIKKINKDLSDEIIHELANTVLTYSDLLTNRKTDYKFNLDKFTNISGKTGLYIQYAQVRAKRILEKSSNGVQDAEIIISNNEERSLLFALLNIDFYFNLSLTYNEPHHLADYLYEISNLFNIFYQKENILNIEDENLKSSRLKITNLFIDCSNTIMNCLGINPVNKM
tara:strand:+ start:337 stop:1974 length:1638 start_codon:yes stop_codon:yes gene_type:complete